MVDSETTFIYALCVKALQGKLNPPYILLDQLSPHS